MAKHSKRYNQLAERIDPDREYTPQEALDLLTDEGNTKFDQTVELHLKTGADVRHADQQVRSVTVLPHGLGKPQRVLVFAGGDAAEAARQAGADYVGDDDLIKKVEDGWLEFDVGLAVPDIMGKIGRLGRILGRRGLMPNPRTGTMVQPRDLGRVIDEAKKGRLEFRTDRTAHHPLPLGEGELLPRATFGEPVISGGLGAEGATRRYQGVFSAQRLPHHHHGPPE